MKHLNDPFEKLLKQNRPLPPEAPRDLPEKIWQRLQSHPPLVPVALPLVKPSSFTKILQEILIGGLSYAFGLALTLGLQSQYLFKAESSDPKGFDRIELHQTLNLLQGNESNFGQDSSYDEPEEIQNLIELGNVL